MCESSLLFMAVIDSYVHSMNTQGNFIKAVDPVTGRCTAAQFAHKFASRNFPGGPVAKTPAPNAGDRPPPPPAILYLVRELDPTSHSEDLVQPRQIND